MNVILKVAGVDQKILEQAVLLAYSLNDWNTSATARQLDISRRSLLRLVRKLELRGKIDEARCLV